MKKNNTNKIEIISKKNLDLFVDNLIKNSKYEVVGVKKKDIRFVFDLLESAFELRLDYDVTILPPKKYFLPQYDKLMDFELGKSFDVKKSGEFKPRILIGVHPYDIIALEQADIFYDDPQKDDFYKKRRKNTIIIGVDIQKVSDRSFASSMGTHVTDSGFDLLLTNIGEYYAVTIGSERGEKLLHEYAKTKPAVESDVKKIDEVRKQTLSQYKRTLKVDKKDWSRLLVANYDHPIWEKFSQKCMECGSCTMVCPTCFCYDVIDKVSLDIKQGSRIRTWDRCLLLDFTRIASGEVFREDVR